MQCVREFKWYSSSSIEILDILLNVKLNFNYFNRYNNKDIRRLLNDIKRILDFLNLHNRRLIEELLNSFPKGMGVNTQIVFMENYLKSH